MAANLHSIIPTLSFLFAVPGVFAQGTTQREDSLSYTLGEVEVNSRYGTAAVGMAPRGRLRWDMAVMNDLPKILGNADPMHYVQMLSGVQTNNEYDSGIHIYGCDNSHNAVGIGDVQLYNVNHLLGLFSVFNASHFSHMNIQKVAADASFPNVLGGSLNMATDTQLKDSISGEGAVGLMSSQATLRLPIGKKSLLVTSARLSYLNLLYSYALRTEDAQLGYSFWDGNICWLCIPDSRNTIVVDGYWGGDKATMHNDSYIAKIKMRWGNGMTALNWQHLFDSGANMKHTLYYTTYSNRLSLDEQSIHFALPSAIHTVGYKGTIRHKWLKAGIDGKMHSVEPQTPLLTGSFNVVNDKETKTMNSHEWSVWSGASLPLGRHFMVEAGIRSSVFVTDDNDCFWFADPSLSLLWSGGNSDIAATWSNRHQNLFQTGFSSVGLPTEFWLLAGKENKPQRAMNLSLTFGQTMFDGAVRLSVEAYYKQLSRLLEYDGTVYNFLNTDYQLSNVLLHGSGENYGACVMLSRQKGWLRGWLAYNVGRAMRHFNRDHLNGTFPASHERVHELNMVMTCRIDKHWNVGATGVFASGTPFTAAEQFYLFSGNVVTQFGDYNGCRLGNYCRLDLSVNYLFRSKKKQENGLNLSFYNALGRKNELFYSWKVTRSGNFRYRPVAFLIRVMPSVSYFFKF